ncbi:GNAT family N-acetyltransferase [Pseudomonas fluorescens]|uniref:GNAT family N-acetyltransferase n=1 Tax=Pseudomonas fluorescens TaxID=294 RepID=UPI001BE6F182|nr:GNAT family N-acetyltransferase [Pseudomonas fluorescens]MBT2374439.1 GNAT family N-acetyltransferase [Pseudomonas fluorescens]
MHAIGPLDLASLYHQTEHHFFAVTCPLHRRFTACVNGYFADLYVNEWNLLFVRVGSSSLGEGLDAILELIPRTVVPVRVTVHQDEVERLQEPLASLGFTVIETTTAMVLDLATFAPGLTNDIPPQVSLTPNLDDWAGPVGAAFAMSAEWTAHYQARHQLAMEGDKNLYHFTLTIQGTVVCALTLSMTDQLARLNDVGTHAAFRGRGHATQLMQAALAHAVGLGARWCFLEASALGVSLYRKMGFKDLFEYQAFWRGPLPALTLPHSGETAEG